MALIGRSDCSFPQAVAGVKPWEPIITERRTFTFYHKILSIQGLWQLLLPRPPRWMQLHLFHDDESGKIAVISLIEKYFVSARTRYTQKIISKPKSSTFGLCLHNYVARSAGPIFDLLLTLLKQAGRALVSIDGVSQIHRPIKLPVHATASRF